MLEEMGEDPGSSYSRYMFTLRMTSDVKSIIITTAEDSSKSSFYGFCKQLIEYEHACKQQWGQALLTHQGLPLLLSFKGEYGLARI